MCHGSIRNFGRLGLGLVLLGAACAPAPATPLAADAAMPALTLAPSERVITSTPLPTRPPYDPGQLVDYVAQDGDNLIALATRFNTTISEILRANADLHIPDDVTTLPPGLPMHIPIYYRSYWGSAYQILPDSDFINGPAQVRFDTQAFVDQQPGWFKNYREYASGKQRTGAGLVDLVATNFSISPRLLLTLLEFQAGALSQPELNTDAATYALGYENQYHRGVYLQLVWAANALNNSYYAWRAGKLIEFDRPDRRIYRPDPWQNAASVALQMFFNVARPMSDFDSAIGPEGFARTYTKLFGDPWLSITPHMPGSLLQPDLRLPTQPGEVWSLTGGPHTGWGQGEPWAALDFAPGLETHGCVATSAWALALADGVVARSEKGVVVLDLDGDGDERTGWVIFYLHLATNGRAQQGQQLKAGQPVGHPSCEGGESTGTHVHVARKYNGEWIAAAGALPFVMEGWVPSDGPAPYEGTLARLGYFIYACTCSDAGSAVVSQAAIVPLPTPEPEATSEAVPTP